MYILCTFRYSSVYLLFKTTQLQAKTSTLGPLYGSLLIVSSPISYIAWITQWYQWGGGGAHFVLLREFHDGLNVSVFESGVGQRLGPNHLRYG